MLGPPRQDKIPPLHLPGGGGGGGEDSMSWRSIMGVLFRFENVFKDLIIKIWFAITPQSTVRSCFSWCLNKIILSSRWFFTVYHLFYNFSIYILVLRRFSPGGIFRNHYFEHFRNFCEDKHDEVKLKKKLTEYA